jgi:hypothetical protein
MPHRAGPGSRRARPHALPLHPAPGLLERHARQRTAHAALSADILSRLAGTSPPEAGNPAAPLSQAQTRVLRYLPTHLSVPEIAGELCVSDRLRCPPGPGQPRMPSPGMPSRFGLAECEMEVLRLGAATGTSPASCPSRPRPPASTCPTSWPGSASPPAPKPPPSTGCTSSTASDLSGPKASLSSRRPRERRSNTAFVQCGGARLSHNLRI